MIGWPRWLSVQRVLGWLMIGWPRWSSWRESSGMAQKAEGCHSLDSSPAFSLGLLSPPGSPHSSLWVAGLLTWWLKAPRTTFPEKAAATALIFLTWPQKQSSENSAALYLLSMSHSGSAGGTQTPSPTPHPPDWAGAGGIKNFWPYFKIIIVCSLVTTYLHFLFYTPFIYYPT